MEYSTGFLFDPDFKRVVMIKKQTPAWQNGLLNGPGGKREPNENSLMNVMREFFEETSVMFAGWKYLKSYIFNKDHVVDVWYGTTSLDSLDIKSLTAEEVGIYAVSDLTEQTVVNGVLEMIVDVINDSADKNVVFDRWRKIFENSNRQHSE